MKPKRIQRKRTKGWRMPENTVYVGRPTIWGNPYSNKNMLASTKVRWYKWSQVLPNREFMAQIRHDLRGKNLACWCPLDQPCHADVLLEIANSWR